MVDHCPRRNELSVHMSQKAIGHPSQELWPCEVGENYGFILPKFFCSRKSGTDFSDQTGSKRRENQNEGSLSQDTTCAAISDRIEIVENF